MNTKKSVNSDLTYEQYVAWCRMSVPVLPKDKRESLLGPDTVAAPDSGSASGPITVRSNDDGHVVIETAND